MEEFFRGKKILVTGHTGFKGSWLSQVLIQWGVDMVGVSLLPHTSPNLFSILGIEKKMRNYFLDIRDYSAVKQVMFKEKPEIVIHLAAQAIVRDSYDDPLKTYTTNTIGTTNILQAIKKVESVKSAVIITTDKVYKNKEWVFPYREIDELGGYDPYSASKAAADIIIDSYKSSFFNPRDYGIDHQTLMATTRAGNVIGGGDWGNHRLMTDIVRSVYEKKEKIIIRNPKATRPWEHVLEPINGYLILAKKLYEGDQHLVGAWNFGPDEDSFVPVEKVVDDSIALLGQGDYEVQEDQSKHEANILKLDTSKAKSILGWKPKLNLEDTLTYTMGWYKKYYEEGAEPMKGYTEWQIRSFFDGSFSEKTITKEFERRFPKEKFIPGKSPVRISGKVFNQEELLMMIEAVLDGWWTEGRFAKLFEEKLAEFIGVKHCLSVNSGSSANLLAMTALTSHLLGKNKLEKEDEVITIAAGFPTTVSPIVQAGCVPVFVDVEMESLSVDISQLKKALSPRTKAVFVAHTLGNPFNVEAVVGFCKEHNLWLIEDNCDALGSEYKNKKTGSFGDISTLSFYPAHHITTAEGGAVLTNNPTIHKAIRSIRDWGRDCWCPTGNDDSCKRRFKWKWEELPDGYDHKYVYSHLGYNLKMTDIQAACGLAQMKKLDIFIAKRKINYLMLKEKLSKFDEYLTIVEPTPKSNPSWFGFLITLTDKCPFTREELMEFLNERKIGTRLLFGGNLTKQPLFLNYDHKYRKVGSLKNTDLVMNRTFWIGTYPGITVEMINWVEKSFDDYFLKIKNQ